MQFHKASSLLNVRKSKLVRNSISPHFRSYDGPNHVTPCQPIGKEVTGNDAFNLGFLGDDRSLSRIVDNVSALFNIRRITTVADMCRGYETNFGRREAR